MRDGTYIPWTDNVVLAGRLSLEQAPTESLPQPSSSGGAGAGAGSAARIRGVPGPKAALDVGTLMPPSAGPTANE